MKSSPCRSLQALISATGVTTKRVASLSEDELIAFIQSVIFYEQQMEPFYVLDLGVVMNLFDMWTRDLPIVQPYYAVKCNPNPALLRAMAALGSNFDCSSRVDIKSILALRVSPDQIVFANPSLTSNMLLALALTLLPLIQKRNLKRFESGTHNVPY